MPDPRCPVPAEAASPRCSGETDGTALGLSILSKEPSTITSSEVVSPGRASPEPSPRLPEDHGIEPENEGAPEASPSTAPAKDYLEARASPSIRDADFDHMLRAAETDAGLFTPFPIHVMAVEETAGGEALLVIEVPTPTSPHAAHQTLRRGVETLRLLSDALRVHEGHRCAVPPSPCVDALFRLRHAAARELQQQLCQNFFAAVSTHRLLRCARPLRVFFTSERVRQTEALRKLAADSYRTKVSAAEVTAKRAVFAVRRSFGRFRVRTRVGGRPPGERGAADSDAVDATLAGFSVDGVQEKMETFLESSIGALKMYNQDALTLMNRLLGTERQGRRLAVSSGRAGRHFADIAARARKGTLFMARGRSPSSASLPGDVPDEQICRFIAANPFVHNPAMFEAMGTAFMGTATSLHTLADTVLMFQAMPTYLVVLHLADLQRLLALRRTLLENSHSAQFELAKERERLGRLCAREGMTVITKDPKALERLRQSICASRKEKERKAKCLAQRQAALVDFTNHFFYSLDAVDKYTLATLEAIPTNCRASFEKFARTVSRAWRELPPKEHPLSGALGEL